jgi:hypothetical protein
MGIADDAHVETRPWGYMGVDEGNRGRAQNQWKVGFIFTNSLNF